MSKEAMKLALEALCDIIPANANIEEVRDKQSKASAALREALAEQPAQQEPVAWPIETNNQVEALAKQCGWDNRRYMTPADYQIWCDRMREFAQLATLQAQPAPAAQQESVGEIGKIVLFGGQCKEVSWRDGKMPPVGTVLYTSLPNPQAAQQGVDEFDVGWNAARRFYTSPQARPAREPTKAMIDAAERIDWSDSDVRGNIVNMWQAMCDVAPQAQSAQRTWVGLTEEEKTELRRKHYPLPLLLMDATEAKLKEKNT